MTRRFSRAAGAATLVALALCACGQQSSSTTTSARSAPVTSPGGNTQTVSLMPCATDQLAVERITSDGTAGTIYLEVVLRTTHGVRCTLDGYPDAILYGNEHGVETTLSLLPKHQPVSGSDPMGVAPTTLTIGPGRRRPVAFYLGIVQVQTNGTACEKAEGLEYKAPGSALYSGEVPLVGGVTLACPPSLLVSALQRPRARR